MRTRLLLAILGVAWALAAAAEALTDQKLSGTMRIRGRSIVDPPGDEARDTHAAFVVRGEAARTLYEALAAEAQPNECLADGSVTKRVGNISCTRHSGGGRYECDFAIDLLHQRIEPGQVC